MKPMAFLPLSPGLSELLLIMAVILLLFGADQLPGIARSLGSWLNRMRRAADEFHDQLLEADRPAVNASPRRDSGNGRSPQQQEGDSSEYASGKAADPDCRDGNRNTL